MKVFLCETIHEAAYQKLKERAEIINDWDRIGEAEALINRALQIGPKEMEKMHSMKVIAVHGTGTDGVNLEEAKKRNIKVVYAPHLNANAVAELNVGLALAACRKIVQAREVIDAGREKEAKALLCGSELQGKTAGLIGLGAIGRRTARILRHGFGMDVQAYTPNLTKERAEKNGCRMAESLDGLLESSDFVFLSLPLTAETYHLMNQERFAKMKESAFLINTSRGDLIDEGALLKSLKEGALKGAASDVLCEEFPGRDNPFLRLENFVVTPHIGANTDEALYTVGVTCVQEIFDVMDGKEPEYLVV